MSSDGSISDTPAIVPVITVDEPPTSAVIDMDNEIVIKDEKNSNILTEKEASPIHLLPPPTNPPSDIGAIKFHGETGPSQSASKVASVSSENHVSTNNNQLQRQMSKRSIYGSSEKLNIGEEDLVLAVTLVQDAVGGRNFTFKTAPCFVRSYIIYHKWFLRWLLYFFIFVDLALAVVEIPTRPSWHIPYWGSILIELVCVGYFLFRFLHTAYFSFPRVFWKDTKNILIFVNIVLTFIDIICYVIWINVAPDTNPVRWSRPLRPLYMINFPDGKQIRRAFRNIRRTVPEIMNVLILFFLSVLLFALLAMKLFIKRDDLVYPNGRPYFHNYADSIWDLYVLVTTANNPDVMMPAYDENNWFVLFFFFYIVICLYIFMSIVLAAIYNNFRKNLKNEVTSAVYGKRKKLAQAFEILKSERGGMEVISHNTWVHLMKQIIPNKSLKHVDVLMKVLDQDANNTITKNEFLKLADLLSVQLSEVKDRMTLVEKLIPYIYNSKLSLIVRRIVKHRFFRFFFDFMIFVNAWFIGFDVDTVDWFFLSVFTIEILLKLYTFGPKEFFVRFWNIFDFLVIGAAVIASIVEAAEGVSSDELRTLDLLLVLRVMRLIKIFGSIKRFKVILMTIVNIGPSILTYGGVIFVFYYTFAIIGMEVFHGLIKFHGYGPERNVTELFCGNTALNGSAFYTNHYCNNNFNDIIKSLVVMFELTVVNQWHVIASGFVMVTNKAARIYFFAFHLCCVVIVLNIFIAFILEAFILEYSLQTAGKLESYVESKIKELGLGIGQKRYSGDKTDSIELVSNEEPMAVEDIPGLTKPQQPAEESDSDTDSIPDLAAEEGLRFHLKRKSRKKVEVLLQQMFEGEIDPDDQGPEDEADLLNYRPRKITLDTVT